MVVGEAGRRVADVTGTRMRNRMEMVEKRQTLSEVASGQSTIITMCTITIIVHRRQTTGRVRSTRCDFHLTRRLRILVLRNRRRITITIMLVRIITTVHRLARLQDRCPSSPASRRVR